MSDVLPTAHESEEMVLDPLLHCSSRGEAVDDINVNSQMMKRKSGQHAAPVNVTRCSSFSEDYETAQEDLSSGSGDLDIDGVYFSFCDEPTFDNCDSPKPNRGKSPPRISSEKTRRVNGKLPVTGSSRKNNEHLDLQDSALYCALKKIVGYSEPASEEESDEIDLPSRNTTKGLAKTSSGFRVNSSKRPSLASTRVAVARKSFSVKAIVQRQPVVKVTRLSLSWKQRQKARQILVMSKSDSVQKSSTVIKDELEVDHYDIVSSPGERDEKQEAVTKEGAMLQTPKSAKPLSLSHPNRQFFEEYATPTRFHSVKEPDLSNFSAKRKIAYTQTGVLSSDSDFEATPHSQHTSQKLSSKGLSTDVKHVKNESSLNSTPRLKRKKILSSYSSGEEEVMSPLFLQMQRAEKEAQLRNEEREEASEACNGSVYDKDEETALEVNKTEVQNLTHWGRTKLGKYEKSPGGKGKEKAMKLSTFPDKIICAACEKNIYWKKNKIHCHPRLSVLVCLKCHEKFNQGTFQIEGENEIYCTLCGDGGDIVLCSYSEHSFCQQCIKRISGENYLNYLLSSDDVAFKCYMCDPKDIKRLQDLCEDISYHFKVSLKSTKQQKEYKSRKYVVDSDTTSTKSHDGSSDSHEDSDGGYMPSFSGGCGVGGGVSCGAPSTSSQGGGEGGSKRRGRSSGRLLEAQECIENSSDKGGGSSPQGKAGKETKSSKSVKESKSGRGQKAKSGVAKRARRRGGISLSGGDGSSSSDSMSDMEESSEVNTDDISLSDSSLFEGVGVKKRKNVKAKEQERDREEVHEGDDSNKSDREGKEHGQPSRKKTKRKHRIVVGHLHKSSLGESDFDASSSEDADNDQPQPPKEKLKRRRHSSLDSTSKSRRKRGRLGSTLSSASGSSCEERLAISVLDLGVGGTEGVNSNNELFDNRISEEEGLQSVKYVTPVKLKSHALSDSSDSEVIPLKRTKKKHSSRKLFSKDGHDEKDGEEGEAGPSTKVKTKVYKTRGRKRKKHGDGDSGSSEDFMSDDLSLRGPRLHNKHKRLRITSFLSSEDSDDPEEMLGKGKDKQKKHEEEEEKPDTPNTSWQKRKNIRKIMADEKLAVSTRTAQREEEERLERLKMKAQLLKPIEDSERVILEQDPESKEVKVCQTYCCRWGLLKLAGGHKRHS